MLTYEVGNARDIKKALRDSLIKNGFMEWVSVPWTNYRDGELDTYRSLTVNLALWFVHILAGNKYEVDWRYGNLEEELLDMHLTEKSEDSSPRTTRVEDDGDGFDDSQDTLPSELSPLSERHKGAREEEDPIHFSFSENQIFTP